MKILLSLAALLCLNFAISQQYSKVKIYADSDGLQKLAELGVPVDHGVRKLNTFLISDFSTEEIQIIDASGYAYEVVIDNVKKYYASQNDNPSPKNANCMAAGNLPSVPSNFDTDANSYAGFYKYQEMLDELDAMTSQYPNLISAKSAISNFQTWEGRPIYHIKISDNPAIDEGTETKVLYTAIHHAREPMSMSQTIFYMWYLLENYATNEEVKYLVDNTEMYFVPCVNPDGYIHNESNDPGGFGMHRKNKRPIGTSNPGVDLNRNYSYQWGTTGVNFNENNDLYPGGPDDGNDYSFSEPETQAMQWLVQNINFTSAFNSHTHGKTLLFPIGSTAGEFADHHDYFSDLTAHMCSQNGYFAQKSSGLYPASGDADDYMYKEEIGVGVKDTIFVMTPEIGSSFWPAQSEVIPTCQEMVFPNMVLSHMTHMYVAVEETDQDFISTITGDFNHDVIRLGREDGAVTVSIEPILNIQSVGTDIIYDLNLRETGSGTISYMLTSGIQFGDEIRYVLETQYPLWTNRDTIVKIYGSLPIQFSDDASTSTNWTGDWISTGAEYVSPSKSFTDGNGDYDSNADEVCELIQSIDLTNATQANATFYAMWEIEQDYDYCQFQVSTNGGSSWQGQCGDYTVEGINQGWGGGVQPDGEPIYEGTQASWVLEKIDLSDYLGQVINVRFRLESDNGLELDGFYFDDFQVAFSTDASGGLSDDYFDVKTFPNPSNNEAIISMSKVISSGSVLIYNQAGKLVYDQLINEQTSNVKVNTSSLPQGIYTVRVIDNGVYAKPVKLAIVH